MKFGLNTTHNRSVWLPLVMAFAVAGCGDDDGDPTPPATEVDGGADSGGPVDTTDTTDDTDTSDTSDDTDATDDTDNTDDTDTTDTSDSTAPDVDGGTTDVDDDDGGVTSDLPDTGAPIDDGGLPDAAMGDADVIPSDAMVPDAEVEEGGVVACFGPSTASDMEDCSMYVTICSGEQVSRLADVCFTQDEGVFQAVLDCYAAAGEELDDCSAGAEQVVYECWAAAEANACVTDVPECEAVTGQCDDVTEAQCDALVSAYHDDYLAALLPDCIENAGSSSCATDIPTCLKATE